MDEPRRRKQYSRLTPAILASILDHELEWAIINYVQMVMGDDYRKYYEAVTSLSDGFRMVYSTECVENQVENGGFNQFFWNSSSQFTEEALAGFQLIGATEHSKVMEEAIAIRVDRQPEEETFWSEDTNAAFREFRTHTDLKQVDDAYYGLTEDLQALRIKYIREHPEQFRS